MIKISARSPIYGQKSKIDWFFDIWIAEAMFFFNMFRHTGFTESYESPKKQTPTSQNTHKSSF